MSQYWWESINKATKSAYFVGFTCTEIQFKKNYALAPGHFTLCSGPAEVWQIDFIQLPLFQGYEYLGNDLIFKNIIPTW